MKTDELKFKKFEEECRRYLYEKEALLQLEKRFVKVNTSNTHYNDNCSRYDPLKKYRFLEAHTNHVNHVFKLMEKEYGSLVLGCTHFNYFKDSFHQLLPHVHLLDGNRGTINYLMKNIELENLESSVEYYYSAKRVSGEELKRIERYLERLKNMKDIGI